jgi:hypothetical protein
MIFFLVIGYGYAATKGSCGFPRRRRRVEKAETITFRPLGGSDSLMSAQIG